MELRVLVVRPREFCMEYRMFFRKPLIAFHILKALRDSGRPLTACEVAKITDITRGKAENYLRRLYLLGLVDRLKVKQKTYGYFIKR